jgi:hypothetical protein
MLKIVMLIKGKMIKKDVDMMIEGLEIIGKTSIVGLIDAREADQDQAGLTEIGDAIKSIGQAGGQGQDLMEGGIKRIERREIKRGRDRSHHLNLHH